MKNQSLRGKLDVSMICIGAIELGSKLVRVKECGESKCKVSGFLPGPHVMDALYGMVEQALGYSMLVMNVVNWRNLCRSRMMSGPHMQA